MGRMLWLTLAFGVIMTAEAGAPDQRPAAKSLSAVHAAQRVSTVSNVDYTLDVRLDGTGPTYSGRVRIAFDWKPTDTPLTIDFDGGEIRGLTVNGSAAASPSYNGVFVAIPVDGLRTGRNAVEIEYAREYSNDGSGLYRFVDPEDARVYLYTDFQPYNANRLFPCFDQPDLKATYTLTVDAPAAWVVISATRETGVTAIADAEGRRRWTFPRSARFSTYLFPLHAGEYAQWADDKGEWPLRLFARQAIARYVDVDEWFLITRQGFEFYEAYFDYPYAFGKYDQVIAPDFNAGAMENVAAVTFSEAFVHRGEPTDFEREDRADVILHELAHMWFGNLVTMRWWDDLWLNESFATYMAALALVEGTEFDRAWMSFYSGMKQWAYWSDQLVTTHPIETEVVDTEQAFANFDGITYGKGASVLKQLAYYIGAEHFRDGVRAYFKAHAFHNTELRDFTGALERQAGLDLDPWVAEWLQTAGLNTVEARYTCKDGRLESFGLRQSASRRWPTLRRHRVRIGLYAKDDDGRIRLTREVPVAFDAAGTCVAALDGAPCPDIIYPNHGDEDFVKVRLDARTLSTARSELTLVEDPLLRAMLWRSLWEMVLDAELSVWDYAELTLTNLPREADSRILGEVLATVYGRRAQSPSVLTYLPRADDDERARAEALEARIAEVFHTGLEAAKPGSDAQKRWFDAWVQVAHSDADRTRLRELLANKRSANKHRYEGMVVDQDRRWTIVRRLHVLGARGADPLRRAEAKRDPSNAGLQSARAAEVSIPTAAVKRRWFDAIVAGGEELTLAQRRIAMRHLFPREQIELRMSFSDAWFEAVPAVSARETGEFLTVFGSAMAPSDGSEAAVERLAVFIDAHPDLPATIAKELRIAHQEAGRHSAILAFARGDLDR